MGRCMRIYTFITAVLVPSVVDTVLDMLIFSRVRPSSRRVRSQIANTLTNGNNILHIKLSHSDMSLLCQMIFMFLLFVGGWNPDYFGILISELTTIDSLVTLITVLFSEIHILSIIVNLFLPNRELRYY
jgi:hypothetical protein